MVVPAGNWITAGGGGVTAADVWGSGPAPVVPASGACCGWVGVACGGACGFWLALLLEWHALTVIIRAAASAARGRNLPCGFISTAPHTCGFVTLIVPAYEPA